jgi:hypothetical protein
MFGASRVAADVMVQEYGPLFRDAYLLTAGWMPHRPKSLACSAGSLCKHGPVMQAVQGLCGQCTGIRDA